MVIGSIVNNIAVFRGSSSVMMTSYVPMMAEPSFYLGIILFAVGIRVVADRERARHLRQPAGERAVLGQHVGAGQVDAPVSGIAAGSEQGSGSADGRRGE